MENNYNKFDTKALKENYEKAYKDPEFKKLVDSLKIDSKIAMKYTSSLKNTICELNNCSKCEGLMYCKNRVEGHATIPSLHDDKLIFSYAPCKFEKEAKKAEQQRRTRDRDIENANLADIDLSDKKRTHVLKWIKNFIVKYNKNDEFKGLYLHGSFGAGKTYLISAMFNELSKKRITTEIVYFPELLRDIKSDFDIMGDTIAYLENVDLLLIDDIGAEKVTEWGRDEILGTILQKRMNNYKTTFFTSNLDMDALEQHLRINSNVDDEMKAKRIIERIKQLTEDIEMISENKRK